MGELRVSCMAGLLLAACTAGMAQSAEDVPMLPAGFRCQQVELPVLVHRMLDSAVTAIKLQVEPANTIKSAEVLASSGDTRAHKLFDSVVRDQMAKCVYVGPKVVPPGAYKIIYEYRTS